MTEMKAKKRTNNHSNDSRWKQYFKMPSSAFFVCLGIGILAWFFVTFSKEYTVSLDYHVHCTNLPAGKSAALLSDSTITLNFKSKGFTFLTPQFYKKNRNIDFSVSQLIQHKGHNLNSYQFSQNELQDYIRNNTEVGAYLLSIEYPDEMTIYLDNNKTQRFKQP